MMVWPGSRPLPAHVFSPYFETYDAADGGLAAQFSYTLPTFATGLTPAGPAVLQGAVADGARSAWSTS